MSDNIGTALIAPIVPKDSLDTFPTHLTTYAKGGWRSVQSIEDRNAIPAERLEVGMVVYVIGEQKEFILKSTDPEVWGDKLGTTSSSGRLTMINTNSAGGIDIQNSNLTEYFNILSSINTTIPGEISLITASQDQSANILMKPNSILINSTLDVTINGVKFNGFMTGEGVLEIPDWAYLKIGTATLSESAILNILPISKTDGVNASAILTTALQFQVSVADGFGGDSLLTVNKGTIQLLCTSTNALIDLSAHRVGITGILSLNGTDITATADELNFLSGVTSPIQEQIDAMTQEEGTFTVAISGFADITSATIKYLKVGKTVTLHIPNIYGTSNSSVFSMTGFPAGILPAETCNQPCVIINNNIVGQGILMISNSAGGFMRVYNNVTLTNNTWHVSALGKSIARMSISYLCV